MGGVDQVMISINSSIWTKKYKIITGKRILICFAVFLVYMLYFHLPFFPVFYLNNQRKTDIADFSEKLLNEFTMDVLIDRHWESNSFSDHGELTSGVVECVKFLEKNNLDIASVSTRGNSVLYRHFHLLNIEVDYWYIKLPNETEKTDGSKQTDQKFKIVTRYSKRR